MRLVARQLLKGPTPGQPHPSKPHLTWQKGPSGKYRYMRTTRAASPDRKRLGPSSVDYATPPARPEAQAPQPGHPVRRNRITVARAPAGTVIFMPGTGSGWRKTGDGPNARWRVIESYKHPTERMNPDAPTYWMDTIDNGPLGRRTLSATEMRQEIKIAPDGQPYVYLDPASYLGRRSFNWTREGKEYHTLQDAIDRVNPADVPDRIRKIRKGQSARPSSSRLCRMRLVARQLLKGPTPGQPHPSKPHLTWQKGPSGKYRYMRTTRATSPDRKRQRQSTRAGAHAEPSWQRQSDGSYLASDGSRVEKQGRTWVRDGRRYRTLRDAKGRQAPVRERSTATAQPEPLTLHWYSSHPGRRAGDITRIDGKWHVITATKQPRTRRLTEMDEDRGLGVEGDSYTTQRIHARPATAAEITAEEERRQAEREARRAATPGAKLDGWLAQHPDAELLPEHMTPVNVTWHSTEDGLSFGTSDDGSQWASLWNAAVERSVTYRTPPDPTLANEAHQRMQAGRAYIDQVARTGVYTDADMERLPKGLAVELRNTARRQSEDLLIEIRKLRHLYGAIDGDRLLEFERSHAAAFRPYGTRQAEQLQDLQEADPPPQYKPVFAKRIAELEADLAAHAEWEAQEAADRKQEAASRGTSVRSARFTKRGGVWAVRVEGSADGQDRVRVSRRNGSAKWVSLGDLISQDASGQVYKIRKGQIALVRRPLPLRKSMIAPSAQWDRGGFHFEFRKAGVLGSLTVTGPQLPQAYHVLCRTVRDAMARTDELLKAFGAGRVPRWGVFRPTELAPAVYQDRYGGVDIRGG